MINAEDERAILHSPPPPDIVISLQQHKLIHYLCRKICGRQGGSIDTL